ncbi:MAG: SRPBCC family protein [Candidatus Dormibacteraeota bacterium]|nr:SRPBCC family protein [Candidatus Dormibacteraeota bacterium]
MGHITTSEQIAAPVETVFAFVDDHRNTTKYMKALTKWAPVGSKTHGKGAQFQVAMKAGPMTLSSVVDITTWSENRAIGWKSTEGFKQTGKWAFKPSAGGTEATFEMDYELPGGIAGRMAARLADPVVRGNIEASVRNLRTQVEKGAKKTVKAAPARKR